MQRMPFSQGQEEGETGNVTERANGKEQEAASLRKQGILGRRVGYSTLFPDYGIELIG